MPCWVQRRTQCRPWKKELVGLDVVGGLLPDPAPLLGRELGLQRGRDLERDIGLDGEDVGQLAVVGLGPEVTVVFRIDEGGNDPHPAPGPADAPIEEAGDVQRGRDLSKTLLPFLVRHHRGPGDHLSERIRDRWAITSSVIPSAKNSFSGSALMLRKGSTATEGDRSVRGVSRGGEGLGKCSGTLETMGRIDRQGPRDGLFHVGRDRRDGGGVPGERVR